jgi:hypothetical protein
LLKPVTKQNKKKKGDFERSTFLSYNHFLLYTVGNTAEKITMYERGIQPT